MFLKNRIPQVAPARNRGIAMVWVVIVIFMIIALVGLSLDTGRVYVVGHQLQNAADAAALAGARVVRVSQDEARQRAISIALANRADGDGVVLRRNDLNLIEGDIVVGRYYRDTQTFVLNTTAPNALKIVARRTDDSPGGSIPLIFGPLFGVHRSNIEKVAIAIATGGTGAGLIALAPSGTGLHINGSVTLNVNDGAMQINSEDDNAVRVIGQPEILADELNVWGDIDPTGGFEFDPDLLIDTDASAIYDPLCPYEPPIPFPAPSDCLPPPVYNSDNDLSPSPGEAIEITGGTHVLEPGYYSGGFRMTGGDITLKPGIYVLDGNSSGGSKSGLVVSGNTNLCAKGVMFYIMGDGVIDLAGTGNLLIDPIVFEPEGGSDYFCDPAFSYPASVDYTYDGVAIFQARDNTNDARLVGTGLMDLNGTLYFPNNHVDLTGTGEGFGNQLIASTVEISGTGDITINYDGRNPAIANNSFLIK